MASRTACGLSIQIEQKDVQDKAKAMALNHQAEVEVGVGQFAKAIETFN